MFRTICSRFAGRTQIPLLNGIRQLSFPNLYRTCSSRLKNPVFISNELSGKGNNLVQSFESEEINWDSEDRVFKHQISSGAVTTAANIINSYGNKIKWNEVISKLLEIGHAPDKNRELIKAYIVKVCSNEKLFSALTSFFKYLIKNKELDAGLLFLFCRVIAKHPQELKDCEEIVYKIFLKLPPNQQTAMQICCSVLFKNRKYHKKVLQAHDTHLHFMKNYVKLIVTALRHNDVQAAFDYLKLSSVEHYDSVLPAFLKHFRKNVADGIIPVSQVVTLFDAVSGKKVYSFPDYIKKNLEDLFAAVNKIDKDYLWVFEMTNVVDNCCKICSGKLKKQSMTNEETQMLKEYLKLNVIFQDNIFIRSNSEEWERFEDFLGKKSYDIVLDGLNLFYAFKKVPRLFFKLIKEIEDMELTPLILGKKHFQNTPEYKTIIAKHPVFLTQNLSDDDVFILYAALNKGKNCFAVSRDKMGFARHLIGSEEVEGTFLKWQATHQCYHTLQGGLVLPTGYLLGYQKSSSQSEDEFRYHVIVSDGIERLIYCVSRMKRNGSQKEKLE